MKRKGESYLLKYPNVLERWHIFMLGKRDVKREMLGKDSDEKWISAFINKEINTALADIELERNNFYTNNTNRMFKMEETDLIKECINGRKMIDIARPHSFPAKSSYFCVTDSLAQFIMDNCSHSVLVSQKLVQSKKQEYHEDVLLQFDINRLENSFILMRHYTAAHSRALRIYDILVARLSIYWSGIRRVAKKNENKDISEAFAEDSVHGLDDIKWIINQYFTDLEDAKYGEKYLPTVK